jgi:hypothetical protein
MGFKLPGKSVQSGTSAHNSALKQIIADQPVAGKNGLTSDDIWSGKKGTPEHKQWVKRKQGESEIMREEQKSGNGAAYGGDGRTWQQADKDSGGDLNQTTRNQKAYEKEMKAKHGKDWNKREDNQWKKRQNTINAAVGSKKVYEVDSEAEKIKDKQVVTDKKIVDEGEKNMAKKGPQQTNEKGEKVFGAADKVTKDLNKSEQKTSNEIAKLTVKETREKYGRGSDEVKAAKVKRKTTKAKNKAMVKTDKKDRKFVRKDERYDRKITRRKDKGKDVTKLETKKTKNLQKEKEFGESLG